MHNLFVFHRVVVYFTDRRFPRNKMINQHSNILIVIFSSLFWSLFFLRSFSFVCTCHEFNLLILFLQFFFFLKKNLLWLINCLYCLIFLFYFFVFPRLHPWHVEAPRPGVLSELQLPAVTTATAIPDLSCICDLHSSSWQCRILNTLSGARESNPNPHGC